MIIRCEPWFQYDYKGLLNLKRMKSDKIFKVNATFEGVAFTLTGYQFLLKFM